MLKWIGNGHLLTIWKIKFTEFLLLERENSPFLLAKQQTSGLLSRKHRNLFKLKFLPISIRKNGIKKRNQKNE
jgi:hypothetical protein